MNLFQATTQAGSYYDNVVAFIDGTARPICRPKQCQELYYSGYKKMHVLKYQSVLFPNGIIGRLDGPFQGRRHDSAVLNLSGLINELSKEFVKQDGSCYTLYGDTGYANQKFIKVGFKNYKKLTERQKQFNADMAALRVCVEYGFGKILQYFSYSDFKKTQKILLQPVKQMYYVATVLTNCLVCLRGTQVCDYFHCFRPSVEEYLTI